MRQPEIYDPNPHFAPSENVNPFHANKFKLPSVDVAALRLPAPSAPLLTLEKVSLSYQSPFNSSSQSKALLDEVTLQLGLGSRVGILGRNGTGKSSLLATLANANALGPVKAIHADSNASVGNGKVLTVTGGQVWRHHQLRIGVVAQHQIDVLSNFLFHTPITYMQHLLVGSGLSYSEQELRSHLGAFGLTGSLALQQIGSLSGGQKARLSFAAVCLLRPQLLFLDEPSNHLSMESIEALIKACQEFAGGLVVVSHNRYLLQQICNELFVIAKKGPAKGAAGKGANASKKGGKAVAIAAATASSSEGKGPVYTVSVRKVIQAETAGQTADSGVSLSSSGSVDHSAMYSEEQRQAFTDLLERAITEQMNS
ncbi:ABC-F family ATP-binding cassette domain-containing protein [archaeon]|nr:MAG: ABC-F family ATP-binding cassette domain-containing protein [archaeon]